MVMLCERFQPSCPHGTRHNKYIFVGGDIIFQPSCPHGTRLYAILSWIIRCKNFNPRAHMGRDESRSTSEIRCKNFNPRAHMGRDHAGIQNRHFHAISTLVPTWDATIGFARIGGQFSISTLVPTWDATVKTVSKAHGLDISTLVPTWDATYVAAEVQVSLEISTLVPTWDATSSLPVDNNLPSHFNPRAHMGRDLSCRLHLGGATGISTLVPTWDATDFGRFSLYRCFTFQPSCPHGTRLLVVCLVAAEGLDFNPRAHMGRDPL